MLKNLGNRLARRMGISEWHQHQSRVPRPRQQFERGLRDHPQRSFTAHHEGRQIVARTVLQGVGPSFDDGAIHQDYLQIEDPIFGHAIFDCTRASTVFCKVSTDGATPTRRWIHRIKQPELLHGFLHFLNDYTWLDNNLVVALIDVQNAI